MKLLAITTGLAILCANAYATENPTAITSTTVAQMPTAAPVIDKDKAEGDAFLKKNTKKKDVVTLPDGLQYKIITKGHGKKPTDTDVVSVNYAGTFIDGTEFDSSYKRHEPTTFPVGGVIPGWTEALKLMPVGSTWMLYIPSDLAYGEQGSPPTIPANKVLIFKVELLEIKN